MLKTFAETGTTQSAAFAGSLMLLLVLLPCPAAYAQSVISWSAPLDIAAGSFANADVYLHDGTIHAVWENLNSGTVTYRKGTYATTEIPEVRADALYLYPNPLGDSRLQLRFGNSFSGAVTCSVRNAAGREVLRRSATPENGQLALVLPDLPQGMYYLIAHCGNKPAAAAFFKK